MMIFRNMKIFSAVLAVLAFAITQAVIPGGDIVGASFQDSSDQNYQGAHIKRLVTQAHAVPTVGLQDSGTSVGGTVSLPITLSHTPNGLAGYYLEVNVSDSSVAKLSGADFPAFGMTRNIGTSDSSMRIAAVDLLNVVNQGDENSTLATVNIVGMARGISLVTVSVLKMDDDDGNHVVTQAISGVVSVY